MTIKHIVECAFCHVQAPAERRAERNPHWRDPNYDDGTSSRLHPPYHENPPGVPQYVVTYARPANWKARRDGWWCGGCKEGDRVNPIELTLEAALRALVAIDPDDGESGCHHCGGTVVMDAGSKTWELFHQFNCPWLMAKALLLEPTS